MCLLHGEQVAGIVSAGELAAGVRSSAGKLAVELKSAGAVEIAGLRFAV